MSYCRHVEGESDVYLIGGFDYLECFGAGWKLEEDSPVHEQSMAPSHVNVAASGAQVDPYEAMAAVEWTDSPDGFKLSRMPEWFHEKYPQPWTREIRGEHVLVHSFMTKSRVEMISHLDDHVEAGHLVPKHAFDRLMIEIEEEGDLYE